MIKRTRVGLKLVPHVDLASLKSCHELGYSAPAAFILALCFTYGLFVSQLSIGKKQYALGIFSELLVPFMNPKTRNGFRAVCFDWDFNWNWNGAAMSGRMALRCLRDAHLGNERLSLLAMGFLFANPAIGRPKCAEILLVEPKKPYNKELK